MIKFVHEYTPKGSHRLTARKGAKEYQGEYASYPAPATIRIKGQTYLAVTGYYTGSLEFPCADKVYQVIEVDTVLEIITQ